LTKREKSKGRVGEDEFEALGPLNEHPQRIPSFKKMKTKLGKRSWGEGDPAKEESIN